MVSYLGHFVADLTNGSHTVPWLWPMVPIINDGNPASLDLEHLLIKPALDSALELALLLLVLWWVYRTPWSRTAVRQAIIDVVGLVIWPLRHRSGSK